VDVPQLARNTANPAINMLNAPDRNEIKLTLQYFSRSNSMQFKGFLRICAQAEDTEPDDDTEFPRQAETRPLNSELKLITLP
jgi:hypothetical protein